MRSAGVRHASSWCRLGSRRDWIRRSYTGRRKIGQKIAEHEISEMVEYLEESKTKRRNDRASEARPVINQIAREDAILDNHWVDSNF
jgi:hypothetical protein